MPDKPPSFQFYPRDFVADMNVHGMAPSEIGRYVWALCCSWLTDTPGEAPEDRWREWMSYSEAEWVSAKDKIRRLFHENGDGTWTQKRMAKERQRQRKRHADSMRGGAERMRNISAEERTALARSAAQTRWAKQDNADSECQPSCLRMPSPAFAFASASAKDLNPPVGPPLKPTRRKKQPDKTITPEVIAEYAGRFNLSEESVRILSERVLLEFDARGYKSAKSALLNWCLREKNNPTPLLGKNQGHYVPRVWYGAPERRPTPGWDPPGCLSWSQGGYLGVECPPPERWRPCTTDEIREWNAAIKRGMNSEG